MAVAWYIGQGYTKEAALEIVRAKRRVVSTVVVEYKAVQALELEYSTIGAVRGAENSGAKVNRDGDGGGDAGGDAKAKASAKPFPAHWGKPPLRQTRDLVQWPGGYGRGSGTVREWIQKKMAEDAIPRAASEGVGGKNEANPVQQSNEEL